MAEQVFESMFLKAEIRKKLKQFELDVHFQATNGCLGILGPSGCGKSMTLKSIAGIVKPDGGRIALSYPSGEEHVLFDCAKRINERPQRRRVGYLFQNYALFPNMTVEQNIAAGLHCGSFGGKRDKSESQKRVREMTERFRLCGLEKQYPGQLSGGQQQRVALARILAYEPDALLLDEPFSAMDTFLREGLRLELAKVLKEYQGISIMVTHDRDEAYQLCSHLLLLHEGKVLRAGRTQDVFDDPGTVEAARLTGCKNISRIQKIGGRRVRALDWGGLELVTEKEVGDDITHIGIRAHDFKPADGTEAENVIPVESPEISEMPFEWYVTLKNGLWWKREKNIHVNSPEGMVPEYLWVDPGAVLGLKNDPSK